MDKELSAGIVLSHYRIVSKLGAGGMGEVYLAQDTSELGRLVALKILSAELASDKDRLQRFTQEARTVSNLNHPNILTVYEFGKTESVSFIATEYVDGVTLRKQLSNRRLKLVDVLDVAIQVVGALNAAHEAGVTHRDLKPENVMVRKDHIVKVLDFGLAKLATPEGLGEAEQGRTGDESNTLIADSPRPPITPSPRHDAAPSPLTNPGVIMGTVSYMSPEQSVGKGVDQRTDIWSFGVVLYEMLAGAVPFQGKDIHRQIIAIQENDPPPLSQQVEGVPDRLEEIVTKCLAKEKDDRYQTAKDLLIDLRNLRRKLDVDAEIERTVAPALRGTSGRTQSATQGEQLTNVANTSVAAARSTSSAEYLVTGIKQHKLAAVVVTLAVVAAVVGLALYGRGRTSNAAGTINSIAVLPFQNRSTDSDTEYLSDGLAESLIFRLSQLPNLKVSPTSSVMRYKGKESDVAGIAKELEVDAVMSGRLAQRGDDLTISVELIDSRTGKLLWAERYERKMSDLLATQREIATAITQKLELKLAGEEAKGITKRYTNNNEAYQLYLKGRYSFAKRTKDDVQRAIEYFQQAIDLDPQFALAYARISEAYGSSPAYPYLSPKEAFPKAKAAAQKALELDPTLPEAHTFLAYSLAIYDWNWVDAEREFKRAIELEPNNAAAHFRYGQIYLAPTGRIDEATAEMKRGLEGEPLDINMGVSLAWVYFAAQRNDHGLEQAKKTYDLEPTHPLGRWMLSEAYLITEKYAEAIALNEQWLQAEPTNQFALRDGGIAYAKVGRADKAEEMINRMRNIGKTQYLPTCRIAAIYVALDQKDKAFEELNKAFEARDWELFRLQPEWYWVTVRDDPRFKDLLKRLNLPK